MAQFNFGIFLILAVLHNFEPTNSQCNQCLSNSVACVDTNKYSDCAGGTISSVVQTCETGRVCTASSTICEIPSATVSPACQNNKCGNCALTNNRFACLSETDYALCFGQGTYDESSRTSCPTGRYCNVEDFGICTENSNGNPTCITTSAPIDPDVFCEGKTGNYAMGSDCKKYIYCYKLAGQYLGLIFTCEKYFNASIRNCQTQPPANC